ncbi:unnamed protein product [Lactuca saligna]|uniref:Uncharacterized protein n=1 Tax=Lactuca saligna TaxID=75948 RepID=A0AA35YIB3_LACSI|nr:unnamed protein product [Lactuca saligna]
MPRYLNTRCFRDVFVDCASHPTAYLLFLHRILLFPSSIAVQFSPGYFLRYLSVFDDHQRKGKYGKVAIKVELDPYNWGVPNTTQWLNDVLAPGGRIDELGINLGNMDFEMVTVSKDDTIDVDGVGDKKSMEDKKLRKHTMCSKKCILEIWGRYEILRNYMPKVCSLGHDMMFWTCTVQVNLEFSSEANMIRKFPAGLALQHVTRQ